MTNPYNERFKQTKHMCDVLDSFNVAYTRTSPNTTEVSCRNGGVLKIIEFGSGEFDIVGMSMEDACKAAVFLS